MKALFFKFLIILFFTFFNAEAKVSSEVKVHEVEVLGRSVIINKNLKKSLKYGNKISADYAILIGEEEINNKIYTIKNLNTGNQNKVKKSLILEFFENA